MVIRIELPQSVYADLRETLHATGHGPKTDEEIELQHVVFTRRPRAPTTDATKLSRDQLRDMARQQARLAVDAVVNVEGGMVQLTGLIHSEGQRVLARYYLRLDGMATALETSDLFDVYSDAFVREASQRMQERIDDAEAEWSAQRGLKDDEGE